MNEDEVIVTSPVDAVTFAVSVAISEAISNGVLPEKDARTIMDNAEKYYAHIVNNGVVNFDPDGDPKVTLN